MNDNKLDENDRIEMKKIFYGILFLEKKDCKNLIF